MHGSPARLDSPWMEWKISFNRIDEVDGGVRSAWRSAEGSEAGSGMRAW